VKDSQIGLARLACLAPATVAWRKLLILAHGLRSLSRRALAPDRARRQAPRPAFRAAFRRGSADGRTRRLHAQTESAYTHEGLRQAANARAGPDFDQQPAQVSGIRQAKVRLPCGLASSCASSSVVGGGRRACRMRAMSAALPRRSNRRY